MRGLLVLDQQRYVLNQKEFKEEKSKVKKIIQIFKERGERVIFTRQVENIKDSPFNKDNSSSEIYEEFNKLYDYLIEKTMPSAFHKSNLEKVLKAEEIDELIIIGFSIRYSHLFTAASASDRGYNVTFIKDSFGIADTEELDTKEIIEYVMKKSKVITVTSYDEFLKKSI